MKPRVLVIGCGIIGQVALHSLAANNKLKNFEIAVLDRFPDSRRFMTLRDLDGSPATWMPGTRISGFPGGNLNWGKNSSLVILENKGNWDNLFLEDIQKIADNLSKIGFPSLKLKCLSSDLVEDSYPVHENANFSSLRFLEQMELSEINLLNGYATKVTRLENQKYRVEYRDEHNEVKNIEIDVLLVCAGPIGTQELLGKSEITKGLPEYIFDHPSFKFGTLRFNRRKLARRGLFGWNRLSFLNDKICYTYLDKEKRILWTLRLFPRDIMGLSQQWKSLKFQIKKFQVGILFHEVMLFFASLASGRILFSKIDIEVAIDFLERTDGLRTASYSEENRIEFLEYPFNEVVIPDKIHEYCRNLVARLKFGSPDNIEFCHEGRVAIHLISSSSHHMSTIEKPQDEQLDFTEISPNLYVAGASIFPESVPGHPTFLGAVTAVYAVQKIFKKLEQIVFDTLN